MRFAILGAGFAGLAVTWHLLNYTKGSSTVDLFDPEPIGGGPSGISSGLLHLYAGKQARKAWQGEKAIQETHRLITVSSQGINAPIVLSKGLLRPALTSTQNSDFQLCAQNHVETQWWDKKTCEAKIEGLQLPPEGGGLFIPDGLTIDTKAYLQGLWQACALLGTQYRQMAMIRQSDLERYDCVLIAMGPLSKNFPPLKDLPIQPVKGQILELKWPTKVAPPPFSLISQKYLVMSRDLKTCLVGSTYEHQFDTLHAEPEKAKQEIMPHVLQYFPALKDAEIVNCRSAFRASSPNHLPLLGKVSDNLFFFTGLGSKGLLYHAWLGKHMARAMLSGKTKYFPPEVHFELPSS